MSFESEVIKELHNRIPEDVDVYYGERNGQKGIILSQGVNTACMDLELICLTTLFPTPISVSDRLLVRIKSFLDSWNNIDISQYHNYSAAQKKIYFKMVSRRFIEEHSFLHDAVYFYFYDCVCIFCLPFTINDIVAHDCVRTDLVNMWNIDLEQLKKDAMANIQREGIRMEMAGLDLYRISSSKFEYGSSVILIKEFVSKIQPQNDILVMPISCAFALCMPFDPCIVDNIEAFREKIHDISTGIPAAERLSERAYRYSYNTDEIEALI